MMGIEEAITVSVEALYVILRIALPPLLITTAVGMALTIFQSVTQINETSLQQVIKEFLTLLVLFVSAPAIFIALRDYTLVIFDRINAMAPLP